MMTGKINLYAQSGACVEALSGTATSGAGVALNGLVLGYSDYWSRSELPTSNRELPHPDGVLVFNLGERIAVTGGDGKVLALGSGEAFVAGAHLRPAWSASFGPQAGIHVHLPLTTLRRLLGVHMADLVDSVVRLEDILGAEALSLGARLVESASRAARVEVLDQALTHRLANATPLDPRQLHGLAALRTRPERDIAEIAKDVGWSRKHFRARVQDAVGIGPRAYRRLVRFQFLLGEVSKAGVRPNWAEIALSAGYCDQSHLLREFKEFSGVSPGAYLASRLRGMDATQA